MYCLTGCALMKVVLCIEEFSIAHYSLLLLLFYAILGFVFLRMLLKDLRMLAVCTQHLATWER